MAEATHADIIKRIDGLEVATNERIDGLASRVGAVEDRQTVAENSINTNHDLASSIAQDLATHRNEFTQQMGKWDGYLKGATTTLKVIAWIIGTGIALAAVISQL